MSKILDKGSTMHYN